MRTLRLQLFVVLALVTALGCEGRGPTAPTDTLRPSNGQAFEVTGVVSDNEGAPVSGAVVTMSHWVGGFIQNPSTVTDGSGAYRIAFTATPRANPLDNFLARAEIVADGYDLYWRSLTATSGSNLVESFRLHRITRIPAGDSIVVSVGPDVGECPGWVAPVCGIVRVTVQKGGRMTVDVNATDQTPEPPPLEICCVSGNEVYGNPLTVSVTAGTELEVKVGLERGVTTTRSFAVKTSLDTF